MMMMMIEKKEKVEFFVVVARASENVEPDYCCMKLVVCPTSRS